MLAVRSFPKVLGTARVLSRIEPRIFLINFDTANGYDLITGILSSMKTTLFVILFASAGFAHGDEPASLIRAINTVNDARDALVADLALDPRSP